ncbi:uncharacterized protein B0I36DRAFT_346332 [Microdochium trichocladiopsis]|uniref:Zn(2)-C6 fungal-type domain-containing protein n=1 Tax=Microdochium trichocladiopsis TaxID=1682393 RepID=A0A9P8YF78_9PEZI|nr:uncharacterized protein B0I36DRAFT_346332 [Microdochium trichocladiopsis]KAH7038345.1 hypothetical protein B0I36DRAFT_346332 [Microdochium trichocladiopsis]
MMEDAIHWTAKQYQGGSKYRASCDSCNEAKVRCSQDKPTCSRCQKSQRTCVYGLSRRSHKSAARPGASAPPSSQQEKRRDSEQQQQKRVSSPLRCDTTTPTTTATSSSSTQTMATTATENPSTTHSTPLGGIMSSSGFPDLGFDSTFFTGTSSLLDTLLQNGGGIGSDLMTTSGGQEFSDLGLDFTVGDQTVADMDDLWDGSTPMSTTISATAGGSSSSSFLAHGSSVAPVAASASALSSSSFSTSSSSTRTSRFITKLASTMPPLCAQGYPLDVQLSNLKAAIGFAEEGLGLGLGLGPDHSDWDDAMPLMFSTLLCSIIKGFENSLDKLDAAVTGGEGSGETSGSGSSSSSSDIMGSTTSSIHRRALSSASINSNTIATTPSSSPTARQQQQQPQFSWGALSIDDDNELALLKRHMWLVQFRRVDAVLQGLEARIKGMKHEQMDQATAQKILASNQTHMWLKQRAQLVRNKFHAGCTAASAAAGEGAFR